MHRSLYSSLPWQRLVSTLIECRGPPAFDRSQPPRVVTQTTSERFAEQLHPSLPATQENPSPFF